MIWEKKESIFNSRYLDSWSSMWSGLASHTRAWDFFSTDSLWTIDSLNSWAINSDSPYNFKEETNN